MQQDQPRPDLARFRSYLRLLAAMHLGPRLAEEMDPSDVAHDTLARAYRSIDNGHGPKGEVSVWLRTVLQNTLQDHLRRILPGKRNPLLQRTLASLEHSSQRLEDCVASPDSSPEERACREEALVRLAKALEHLSDDQRTAVELKHLRGWPVAQVSQHMGRSEEAVAGLLRRGMKELRRLLADLK